MDGILENAHLILAVTGRSGPAWSIAARRVRYSNTPGLLILWVEHDGADSKFLSHLQPAVKTEDEEPTSARTDERIMPPVASGHWKTDTGERPILVNSTKQASASGSTQSSTLTHVSRNEPQASVVKSVLVSHDRASGSKHDGMRTSKRVANGVDSRKKRISCDESARSRALEYAKRVSILDTKKNPDGGKIETCLDGKPGYKSARDTQASISPAMHVLCKNVTTNVPRSVRVHYATGMTEKIRKCFSITDVRLAVAHRNNAFAPEVTLHAMDDESDGFPSDVMAVINKMPDSVARWNSGFHAHVVLGDPRGIKVALAKGADIHSTHHSTTALIAAAYTNPEVTTLLLAAGADGVDRALQHASGSGNVSVVQELLRARADVNWVADNNETALHWAIGGESVTVVEMLLHAGANPQVALHTAVFTGNVALVKVLIHAGANVNLKCGPDKESPIMTAVLYDNLEVTNVLLDAGVEPAEKNSALLAAVKMGKVDIAKRLEKDGIDARSASNGSVQC